MNKKLHILFLCGWYPSRVSPNNGDFIQRHAKTISLLHKVSVLHIVSDKNCVEEIEIESKVEHGVRIYIGYIKNTKNPIYKAFLFYKVYRKILVEIGFFDLIHLNTLYPFGLLALHQKIRYKKPYLISEHWTGYHKPQANNISLIRKFLSKTITKKATYICPVSNDLKEAMESLGLKGNYKPVPNVVNTTLFSPKESTNSIFTILHASNLVNKHKNIEGILRVIAKLQEKIGPFVFKLIGEDAKQYKSFAKKLKISDDVIVFEDHASHKKIAAELNNSNLFVLFSNYENLPCVILESFATGTPVISTNVGGIKEYFPKNFGYLIDKGDMNELIAKIIEVHTNFKVNKPEMHAYVEDHFSEKIIAQKFTNLYESSLKLNN